MYILEINKWILKGFETTSNLTCNNYILKENEIHIEDKTNMLYTVIRTEYKFINERIPTFWRSLLKMVIPSKIY